LLEIEPCKDEDDDFPASAHRRSFLFRRLYKPAFELAASIDLARARVSRHSGTAIAVAADVPGVPALVAVERELVKTNFHSPTATSWTLARFLSQGGYVV
jgi:hypothetical protein